MMKYTMKKKQKSKIIDSIDCVYFETETANFWWGEYGLKPCESEGVFLFLDKACTKALGYVDIYSQSMVKDLMYQVEDPLMKDRMEKWLSSKEGKYQYIYPETIEEKLSAQVIHEAPLNQAGLKPMYIIYWSPHEYLNRANLKEGIQIFMKAFYQKDIGEVWSVDEYPFEEASQDYKDFIDQGGANEEDI